MPVEIAEPLAVVFGLTHTAVINASDKVLVEQKRINYVTPTNYLELVSGYVKTLWVGAMGRTAGDKRWRSAGM